MNRRGFSMIELIVGIGLFSLMLITANLYLFYTLRSARKAAAVGTAKNEGAYIVNAITQTGKYAERMVYCGPDRVEIERTDTDSNPGNDLMIYRFAAPAVTAQVGAVGAQTNMNSSSVTISACSPATGIFSCDNTAGGSRWFEVCFVTENSGAGSDVTQTAGGGGVRFQTRVSLRNY